MVSSVQIIRFYPKKDDTEKVRSPDAFLKVFQHVLHVRFMSLPKNFYFSDPMMSWGNIKYVSKA